VGRTALNRPRLLNAGMLILNCLIHFSFHGPDTIGRTVPVSV